MILGFCRVPGSQDHSCAPKNLFPALAVPVSVRGPPEPQGDHNQIWGHVSQLMPGPRNPCEPISPSSYPRSQRAQTTGIWACGVLGRLMSRLWAFPAWFELLFFFWTTQTIPQASFLEKSEHCRICGLREELEFSSLSLGSRSEAPVWPCAHPRRSRKGMRDCPRHMGT